MARYVRLFGFGLAIHKWEELGLNAFGGTVRASWEEAGNLAGKQGWRGGKWPGRELVQSLQGCEYWGFVTTLEVDVRRGGLTTWCRKGATEKRQLAGIQSVGEETIKPKDR